SGARSSAAANESRTRRYLVSTTSPSKFSLADRLIPKENTKYSLTGETANCADHQMTSGERNADTGQRMAADGLARARPGEVGIDARMLEQFLDTMAADGIDLHSLVLHRKGCVAAEMYWWPYGPERPRVMHSVAKSFTACAIGMALEDGRFALSDKVVGFFP